MTTIRETRVMPEDSGDSWRKLSGASPESGRKRRGASRPSSLSFATGKRVCDYMSDRCF